MKGGDRVQRLNPEDIAEKFVAARLSGRSLPGYPGPIPDGLDSAYAIQDQAISQFGDEVAGWKIGRIWPPHSENFGANRLAGPIFRSSINVPDHADLPTGYVFHGGFGAAEAEFLLRIGVSPDPAKASYSLAEAAAMIDCVHTGIEIASSPLPTINELGPAVTVSDFGNNNGLIVGSAIEDWEDSGFADWPVSLLIDGAEAGTGMASAFPDGPIGSVRFLLEHLARRGIALPAGTWVSSGAVTGVHPVSVGQRVEARFGRDYSVSCMIKAAATA